MKRTPALVSLIVALAVTAAGLLIPSAAGATRGGTSHSSGYATPTTKGAHWVNTWAAMPQLTESSNMPPAPFTQSNRVFENATLRQTVHVTVGGRYTRIRLSNAFGGTNLPVTSASVALPADGKAGVSAIVPASARPVTFDGQPGIDIPKAAQAVSDPLDLEVKPGTNLTVTLYLATGQASTSITSHPGSRTTSYMLAGNHLDDADLTGATAVDHWYFLSGIEAWSKSGTAAAVMLGDSLTDGRGSTTNMNNRWPDQLLARLQSRPATSGIAILNQAAGGNCVLRDCLGPSALSRVDRDVLAQSGVSWLFVFSGVNDIGGAGTTDSATKKVTADLVTGYQQIITRAHAQGIRVYGATLTPFGGNGYDDATAAHEAARQAVNDWIRTSGRFDAVVDFDRAVRDPQNPRLLSPAYDVGDHLHLNPTGYQALADAVPAGLLKHTPIASAFPTTN
ncbi:SGNH/GDSL hydrolase family protein [Streptomyces sp. NBC_00285]|uniref:SGNH/GDSL hydrolase family protein n=1 Tax=Streptomyces sp. NBC_00285 TaxID=2975700 RepID=UPI002E2BFBB6|nr:SGNH/GDSL hydrolase family protein [Streptomyces sp. NBC_00285]